jgi:aspartyl/glutamyl-tRNA(Asn/Gln) amidotransferase C subunit
MAAGNLGETTVRELAVLCKLRLEDGEVQRLGHELGAVLGWVDALWPDGAAAPHAPISPDRQFDLRADEPGPMLPHERVLAGAPDPREGSLAVPRIVEG